MGPINVRQTVPLIDLMIYRITRDLALHTA